MLLWRRCFSVLLPLLFLTEKQNKRWSGKDINRETSSFDERSLSLSLLSLSLPLSLCISFSIPLSIYPSFSPQSLLSLSCLYIFISLFLPPSLSLFASLCLVFIFLSPNIHKRFKYVLFCFFSSHFSECCTFGEEMTKKMMSEAKK